MSLLLNDCVDADYFDACKELQNKYGIPAKPYDNSEMDGKNRALRQSYDTSYHECYFPLLSKVEIAQNYSLSRKAAKWILHAINIWY